MDTEERKLMYVGMTRANDLLYMSSVDKASPFLNDINGDYLRMTRGSKIRPFQFIPRPDYKLNDQVLEPNRKEEAVRQWLLRELTDTLGYPLTLVTLE